MIRGPFGELVTGTKAQEKAKNEGIQRLILRLKSAADFCFQRGPYARFRHKRHDFAVLPQDQAL